MFENEVGFSQTKEEKTLVDQARKVMADRLKEKLFKKFQRGLETRDANDLKEALTGLDVALTQELRQNDIDSDRDFESIIKTARSWYFSILEFDSQKSAVKSLDREAISKVFGDEKPSSNICLILQAMFLILGYEVKDDNVSFFNFLLN